MFKLLYWLGNWYLSKNHTDDGKEPNSSVDFNLLKGEVSSEREDIVHPNVLAQDDNIEVRDDAQGTETLTLSGADAALFEIVGSELHLKAGVSLDHETDAALDVSVQIDDATIGDGIDSSASTTLNITDVNEAPTVTLTNVVSAIAENADTESSTKVADIEVRDDAQGTETLTLSGADAALFEIVGSELHLKAGVSLDHETDAALDVSVQIDDATIGDGIDSSASTTLNITDVNEAPTVTLTNVVSAIAENADTESSTKVADIEVRDDAQGTETLTLSGADAALFEIVGSELHLKAGVSLDHETDAALDVSVQIDDATIGDGIDSSASTTLNITDVNEAPTVTLTNVVSAIAENADTESSTKVADIEVRDDAQGTETLTLSGADAALFEIVGSELHLKAGVSLDHETDAALDVSVQIDDATIGDGIDSSASTTLNITDVNEAPTVTLTNVVSAIAENADTESSTKVADIEVRDDAQGTETLTLSGADAALFEIVGSELHLKAGVSLDHETDAALDVSVQIDDATIGDGIDSSASTTLNITDVNEAPTVTLTNVVSAIAENADTESSTKVADIEVRDDAQGTETLTLSGADAALFEIVGSELHLKAGVSLDHETDAALDVSVQIDDATIGDGIDSSASTTLNITDVNEAPTVTLTNVVSAIAENADTESSTKVADIEVRDDAQGTETLTLSGADAALFEIVGSELHLKAGVSLDHETDAALDVSVQIDDATIGDGIDSSASTTLNITDVNEAPTVTLTNVVSAIAENADTESSTKVADIEVRDDAQGTETLTLSGADAALFEIVGSELHLKAGVSLDHETDAALDVSVQIDDATIGDGIDSSASTTLNITDVNEAPTVTLTNVVSAIAENADTESSTKVADIEVRDDAQGTETLTLSGADAALFEIVGSELHLKAGVSLDHETDAALDVSVQIDDATIGDGIDSSASTTLNITDVNEAPTVTLTNVVSAIAENADTESSTKVADIEVRDDAQGTETLTLSGADAALFEIVGSELHLKAGVSLDHETDAALDVSVQIDDATIGDGIDSSASTTLNITDVNEAPTVTLTNVVSAIAENADTESSTKVADIEVRDDAQGTETLTLSGADAALFEIVGSELHLKAGVSLDHETDAALDVSVQIDDATIGDGIDSSASTTLNITDVQEEQIDGEILQGGNANDSFSSSDVFDNANNYVEVDGGSGYDTIYGTSSDDVMDFSSGPTLSNIEEIDGGYGDDTIIGTNVADTIEGNAGNDTLSGGGGDDTFKVHGSDGIDQIDGGSGYDTLQGGGSSDYFGVNSDLSNWSNLEEVDGGSGYDTIYGTSSDDVMDFSSGPTLSNIEEIDGGYGDDTIIGTNVADTIEGNAGNDTLSGGGGDDTFKVHGSDGIDQIDGGSGYDTLQGGGSSDYFGVNSDLSNWSNLEEVDGGSGYDTIYGTSSDDVMDFSSGPTLSNIEEIDGGYGDDTIIGTNVADTIEGNAGNDTLSGGGGDDTFKVHGSDGIDQIDGGSGYDTLQGGGSSDYFGVNSDLSNWSNLEEVDGGSGYDTIYGTSSDDVMDFSSGPTLSNIEEIDGGYGDDTIIGTNVADTIEGNAGNDTLSGGGGDDTFKVHGSDGIDQIDGGSGYDTLQGGGSSDYFGVNSDLSNWSNLEEVDGGSGYDTIYGTSSDDVMDFSSGPTLSNIEEIDGGYGDDTIIGTNVADTIEGNAGNDTLSGGGGDDTFKVHGSDGIDQIDGGSGYDTLQGGGSSDYFGVNSDLSNWSNLEEVDGGSGYDTIYGTSSDDVMDFSSGPTLSNIEEIDGGYGDDTIIGTNVADTIEGNAGNDTLSGGGGDDTFKVHGSDGIDQIDGGSGYDTLQGGGSSDYFGVNSDLSNWSNLEEVDGGSGYDTIYGTSSDDVMDFSSGPTLSNIEEIDGGYGDDTIIGTNVADTIEGNAGNDTLSGGGGDDWLTGDSGADTFEGGDGMDVMLGGKGDDTFRYTIGHGMDTVVGGSEMDTVIVDAFRDPDTDTPSDILIEDAATYNARTGSNYQFDHILVSVDGSLAIDSNQVENFVVNSGNSATTISINGDFGSSGASAFLINGIDSQNVIDLSDPNANKVIDTSYGGNNTPTNLILGSSGDDVLYGTEDVDTIYGLGGDDLISAGLGNDTIYGGTGNDVFLFAEGDGNDQIFGGQGSTWVDTIHINDSSGGNNIGLFGTDWTLVLSEGTAAVNADSIELTDDSSGVIALQDGSKIEFEGIEVIEW